LTKWSPRFGDVRMVVVLFSPDRDARINLTQIQLQTIAAMMESIFDYADAQYVIVVPGN
jgi:hypothetical protein